MVSIFIFLIIIIFVVVVVGGLVWAVMEEYKNDNKK
jgi:Na+-transporting methylmalonyl-CoA/oxaloacetate decarboxylase gamma subunit